MWLWFIQMSCIHFTLVIISSLEPECLRVCLKERGCRCHFNFLTMNMKRGSRGQSCWAPCVVPLAFMWRLSRQICQYQSLRVCRSIWSFAFTQRHTPWSVHKQNDRPSSTFQSAGLEPCYYTQNSWQGFYIHWWMSYQYFMMLIQ